MGKVKVEYKWLWGKKMPYTHWGMGGCSHGVYSWNYENYYYGIKGVFGLRIFKEWGSYY